MIFDGPEAAPVTILLAHGAGAPMDHPWMSSVARGMGEQGIRVVRFNFAYMKAGRKAPDR